MNRINTASPIAHYNSDKIKDMMGLLLHGSSAALASYHKKVGDSHLSQDQYNLITTSIESIIRQFEDDIIIGAASLMASYLGDYGVSTQMVDEQKLAYYTGEAMIARLSIDLSDGELGKLVIQSVRLHTIAMLDYALKGHRSSGGRKQLRERMEFLVISGKVEPKLGRDGIYVVYKTSWHTTKSINP